MELFLDSVVEEEIKDGVFQERAALSEDRDDVDGSCGPVSGHETRQVGVPVGHLDGESEVADVFEETQEKGDVVVLEVALPQDQDGDVEAAHQ